MKRAIVAAFVCSGAIALAQEFQLKTPDGRLIGPIDLKEGQEIQIGGTKATVVNVKTRRDQILNSMQSIVIPEIDFRKASMYDVVAFLQEAALKFDKRGRGINLIMNMSGASASVGLDPFAPPSAIEAPTLPTITMSARYISLLEILKVVTSIANLKYLVRDGVVMIVPLDTPEGEIVTRAYDVLPSCEEKACFADRASHGKDENSDSADWKEFFASLGVKWPKGSSIKYMPALGRIVVANTAENLDVFERILGQLNVQPFGIEIESQFVAFDVKKVAEIGALGITTDRMMGLWTNGYGTLVAAPKVLTQSGQEATAKGVTECRYPTEFTVSGPGETNTNTTVVASVVEPGGFETREVGVILSALPDVSSEGTMINVTFSAELVHDPVWKDYGSPYVDSNGKVQQAQMPQPFFHTCSVCTSVSIANGHRVLAGGGMPMQDGKRVLYVFLTAKKVGTRGEDIRTEGEVKQKASLEL